MNCFADSPRSSFSAGMLRKNHSNVSLSDLAAVMSDEGSAARQPTDLAKFLEHVKVGSTTPHAILIDASTSFEVAKFHPSWLKQGAHVVTANKRALADSLELYNSVFNAVR